MERLLEMLSYTRAHQSEGERLFVDKFINPYNPKVYKTGNEVLAYVVTVGGKKRPPVLWSSHVDTVHGKDDPVMQTVVYDESGGFAYKDDGRPLGADDGAGVWLMLEMIDAKVAGTYIFHRGEERGGIGSSGMALHHKAWLSQFKWAIAFDRRGDSDIITEQSPGVCASDDFAKKLAMLINEGTGLTYAGSPNGIFTDTANYRRLIPECTNLSVGYDNEHTGSETLDTWHLMNLRNAMIRFTADMTNSLPATRDHTAPDPVPLYGKYGGYGVWDTWNYKLPATKKKKAARAVNVADNIMDWSADDVTQMRFNDLVKLVREAHPEDVAGLIVRLAEDVQYVSEQYYEATGEESSSYT